MMACCLLEWNNQAFWLIFYLEASLDSFFVASMIQILKLGKISPHSLLHYFTTSNSRKKCNGQ